MYVKYRKADQSRNKPRRRHIHLREDEQKQCIPLALATCPHPTNPYTLQRGQQCQPPPTLTFQASIPNSSHPLNNQSIPQTRCPYPSKPGLSFTVDGTIMSPPGVTPASKSSPQIVVAERKAHNLCTAKTKMNVLSGRELALREQPCRRPSLSSASLLDF